LRICARSCSASRSIPWTRRRDGISRWAEFPNAIFFTSKLIFDHDNWFIQLLHNQAAMALQRRFHLLGTQMIILPMKLSV